MRPTSEQHVLCAAARRLTDTRCLTASNPRRLAAHVTSTSRVPHDRVARSTPWPRPHGAELLRIDVGSTPASARLIQRAGHTVGALERAFPEHQVMVPKGRRASRGAREICRRRIGLHLDHALSRVARRRGGRFVGSGSRSDPPTRRCDGARLSRDLLRQQRTPR